MNQRILLLDDEQAVLNGIVRRMKLEYSLTTATSGQEALERIRTDGPFAVILTDMRMPGMSGIEFIRQARKLTPETVFIMLTGNQDQATAIQAMNEGHVYRFLNKPCDHDALRRALDSSLRQYRLIHSEKELLQQTFVGAMGVLTDVIDQCRPEIYRQASSIEAVFNHLRESLGLKDQWEHRLAAKLGLLGLALLSEEENMWIQVVPPQERHLLPSFQNAIDTSCRIIGRIPRLERVAEIISQQYEIDGSLFIDPEREDYDLVPIGATLLRVAIHWNFLVKSGLSNEAAIAELQAMMPRLSPRLVSVLGMLPGEHVAQGTADLAIDQLSEGMVVAEDVISFDGAMLLRKGHRLTWTTIEKLRMNSGRSELRLLVAAGGDEADATQTPCTPEASGVEASDSASIANGMHPSKCIAKREVTWA